MKFIAGSIYVCTNARFHAGNMFAIKVTKYSKNNKIVEYLTSMNFNFENSKPSLMRVEEFESTYTIIDVVI